MGWTIRVMLGFALLASAAACGGPAPVQAAEKGDLKVVFPGLSDNAGRVRIALVNTKPGYKDEEKHGFRLADAEVKDRTARHTFADVPFGIYSIKAYHDQNGDERLNKNLFGVPQEPYGFSNDVRGRWGPPAYERTLFRFLIDGSQIAIELSK